MKENLLLKFGALCFWTPIAIIILHRASYGHCLHSLLPSEARILK